MGSEIKDYRQLAAYINERVRDEEALRLLTGMPEAHPRDLKSISSIYRLLQVTFAVMYCKWLNEGRSSARQGGYKHSGNAVRLFELLYKAEPLGLDAVVYAVTEIKRDVVSNPSSLFRDILSAEAREYSRYYGTIYEWQKRLAGSERNSGVLFTLTKDLVTDMIFIEGMAIRTGGKRLVIGIDGKEYDLRDVLYRDETGGWHILRERYAYGNEKRLTYVSLDDFSETDRTVKY